MSAQGDNLNGEVRSRILFLAVRIYGLAEEEALSIIDGAILQDETINVGEVLDRVRGRAEAAYEPRLSRLLRRLLAPDAR